MYAQSHKAQGDIASSSRPTPQPLLVEMSNWISKTRLKSALLFRTLIVYCEEHLTVETHKLIPHLQRALHLAISEKVRYLLKVVENFVRGKAQ